MECTQCGVGQANMQESKLDKFKLYFEYDLTLPQVKKRLKARTIKKQ